MIAPGREPGRYVSYGWLGVALVATFASILRAIADGQDLNFDLVTYHYYLGHTAFVDRTALDFLPASFQGYQSPLPYALLVWLDSHGVPPVLNAAIHASIHALNLVLLLFLSRLLLGPAVSARDRVVLMAIWLLGAIAPVYWQLVGTSFADLSTSVLILGGLWLIAVSLENREARSSWIPMLMAGAWLAGVATGMRFHNAIYVAALAFAIGVSRFERRESRLGALGAYCAAAAAGWFMSFAPWGWRNFREFANPVFPLFNGIFRSPDFPSDNLPLTGFVPDSLERLLTLPFRMAGFADWVYVERRLPDVRPALLVATALALAIALAYRRITRRPPSAAVQGPARKFIVTFFGVGVILWLATSCNGRYGVSLFLLGGPICGALLLRLLPVRHVALIAAAVVAWQVALQQASFALPRWTSGSWTSSYFDWDAPEWIAQEPVVFLTFGYQTASALVPRTHPDSNHVNLVGQYSIQPDGPGSKRARRLMDVPNRRIYGVFDFYFTQQSDPAAHSIKRYFGEHLSLWGLEFTATPCTLIPLKVPATEWAWIDRLLSRGYRGNAPEYIVCELRTSSASEQAAALKVLRDFRARLVPLAAACPKYLGAPLALVRHPGQWIATNFASLEFRIEFYDGGAVVLQQMRPPYATVILTTASESVALPRVDDCLEWPTRLEVAGRAGSP